ncbi:hypothetical protein CEXT_645591 [Caerostris extrusa]|uniref:Uncharacterized protein n=1 Tax=Caerostris extrusa TaxID=172846 RepID=A0AAV4MI86_CAEEX|nr:hypothetical protein CEXT_645591 [Caerostris extrusa]
MAIDDSVAVISLRFICSANDRNIVTQLEVTLCKHKAPLNGHPLEQREPPPHSSLSPRNGAVPPGQRGPGFPIFKTSHPVIIYARRFRKQSNKQREKKNNNQQEKEELENVSEAIVGGSSPLLMNGREEGCVCSRSSRWG